MVTPLHHLNVHAGNALLSNATGQPAARHKQAAASKTGFWEIFEQPPGKPATVATADRPELAGTSSAHHNQLSMQTVPATVANVATRNAAISLKTAGPLEAETAAPAATAGRGGPATGSSPAVPDPLPAAAPAPNIP